MILNLLCVILRHCVENSTGFSVFSYFFEIHSNLPDDSIELNLMDNVKFYFTIEQAYQISPV